MRTSNVLLIAASLLLLQTACNFRAGAHSVPQDRNEKPRLNETKTPVFAKTKSLKEPSENQEYDRLLTKHWETGDFEWLDKEAAKQRLAKERLPGGYWKLRQVYRIIEESAPGKDGTAEAWEAHIGKLELWSRQRSTSTTARVALALSWIDYGWRARGTGFSDSITPQGQALFTSRLGTAETILRDASKLNEKCPEWYLASLLLARGQGWEREEFESVFAAGIALEPTYYYLHNAKAGYLLPRWYGEPGEWEQFAEVSANRLGGEQGDVLFFAVYSSMMEYHSLDFMNTHKQAAPRLLRGFRAIEKLYGSTPQRLNEAALISVFANVPATAADLMKQIGEDYDESVWRSKTNFDMFRQLALKMNENKSAAGSKAQGSN
jgi:hypothetical protein